jgi:mediator of RNA polymerase II transcription subunit 31
MNSTSGVALSSSSSTSSSVLSPEGGFSLSLPSDEERLLMDLEFVQSLTNARYLHYLAGEGYFENNNFMNYLRHLQYWKESRYARYLTFPQCLAVLDALVDETAEFKLLLKYPDYVQIFQNMQMESWQSKANRASVIATDEPSAAANLV